MAREGLPDFHRLSRSGTNFGDYAACARSLNPYRRCRSCKWDAHRSLGARRGWDRAQRLQGFARLAVFAQRMVAFFCAVLAV
jgi:hypothetical protein